MKFEIASVKRTRREYEYQDFSFSKGFSKSKKGVEYTVEITATDGERYFIFHQPKSDPTMRPYKIMYVGAGKMVSEGGTKYSPENEGAYKVNRIYTKEEFAKHLAIEKENLVSRQKKDALELERLITL